MMYRKRAIDRLIRRTIFEMFLLVFAVIGSYFVFNKANLSESANIAREFATGENALQVMVGRNDDAILLNNTEHLIDKTVLTVRNPNRDEKYVDIYLVIVNPSEVDLNGMYIKFMDKTTNANEAQIDLNTYKLKIYSGTIKGYESIKDEVQIYDENYTSSMSYTFKVEESYYQ